MFEVKLVTFKTNHTIIGKVEISPTHVKIKQPVQVIIVPPKSEKDQGGIAFSPFIEFAQEFTSGFEFAHDDILLVSTPVVELENQYNTVFGSGIQIAKTIPV
jgi:hypothetical protein